MLHCNRRGGVLCSGPCLIEVFVFLDVTFFGSNEESAGKSCDLLAFILSMLHSCFQHDCEGLLTKETFTQLEKPLVNQVRTVF